MTHATIHTLTGEPVFLVLKNSWLGSAAQREHGILARLQLQLVVGGTVVMQINDLSVCQSQASGELFLSTHSRQFQRKDGTMGWQSTFEFLPVFSDRGQRREITGALLLMARDQAKDFGAQVAPKPRQLPLPGLVVPSHTELP